jgi:hypothetical protein
MTSVQENTVGSVIEYQVLDTDGAPLDISGATNTQLIFKNPSGVTITKTAAFVSDGTDGKLQYVTVEGDLVGYGAWQIQAHLTLLGADGRTEVERSA